MSIRFDENKKIFYLETNNTMYVIGIEFDKYVQHLFYGNKNEASDASFNKLINSYSTYHIEKDNFRFSYNDSFPEMSFYGSGDFRTTGLRIRNNDGNDTTEFFYDSYRITDGRQIIEGLPYAEASNCQTLEITMKDMDVTSCTLKLYYTLFPEEDIITRYASLSNCGDSNVNIEKFMSLSLDISYDKMDLISMYGKPMTERLIDRSHISPGRHTVSSSRGCSSHQSNPFICICDQNAGEEKGNAYGFNLVYSGSFSDEIEWSSDEHIRILMGINPDTFEWLLEPGETFETPEAVMTYTDRGIGQMSRNMHKFIRKSILPKERTPVRPVVLNSWEACYFDISEDVLLDFADKAKKYGIDTLVMDDGWFSSRVNDQSGLGDWWANKDRFPDGLGKFVTHIRSKGMSFGIWIEPEMVNPDSDLYRSHPEWSMQVPGRESPLARNQLILDMTNPDVIEYLKGSFSKTFENVPISYIKWDMNRQFADPGSLFLPPERQKEFGHRYIMGVYSLINWLRNKFPEIMIETCAGGGGRFDLGMMKYGDQIWTSDNTNAAYRMFIQYGCSLAYPASTMSCHVSDPEGSEKEMNYKWIVAVQGMLGYELNILKTNEDILDMIPEQIKKYRESEDLIKKGDLYRLIDPYDNNCFAYYYTNSEKSEFLMSFVQSDMDRKANKKEYILPIKCAETGSDYLDTMTGIKYSGKQLRNGIKISTGSDKKAQIFHFIKK